MHQAFQIDFDMVKECQKCGYREKMYSSDPMDSFVLMTYHFELINELNNLKEKDIIERQKKG